MLPLLFAEHQNIPEAAFTHPMPWLKRPGEIAIPVPWDYSHQRHQCQPERSSYSSSSRTPRFVTAVRGNGLALVASGATQGSHRTITNRERIPKWWPSSRYSKRQQAQNLVLSEEGLLANHHDCGLRGRPLTERTTGGWAIIHSRVPEGTCCPYTHALLCSRVPTSSGEWLSMFGTLVIYYVWCSSICGCHPGDTSWSPGSGDWRGLPFWVPWDCSHQSDSSWEATALLSVTEASLIILERWSEEQALGLAHIYGLQSCFQRMQAMNVILAVSLYLALACQLSPRKEVYIQRGLWFSLLPSPPFCLSLVAGRV